jgi:putative colanic acid biosynthesis acetyltransferase WcaF
MAERNQATPYDSPWSIQTRIGILIWEYAWLLLCSWTPKPLNPWRLLILRLFGTQISGTPFVHQRARIQIPWKLILKDRACIGDRSNLYTLKHNEVHEAATISQEAYLCTGTHDIYHPSFALITKRIVIQSNAFIGARAFIMPGVTIEKNAVVGACSVVIKDVQANVIAAGNPAKVIASRTLQ